MMRSIDPASYGAARAHRALEELEATRHDRPDQVVPVLEVAVGCRRADTRRAARIGEREALDAAFGD